MFSAGGCPCDRLSVSPDGRELYLETAHGSDEEEIGQTEKRILVFRVKYDYRLPPPRSGKEEREPLKIPYSCGALTIFCHKSSALLHDIELSEVPYPDP